MSQLTYQDQSALPAFEGGLYDNNPVDVVSRTPGGNVKQVMSLALTTVIAAVAQVSTLTVDTAANADAYNIYIGAFHFSGTTSGTDASAQATAIRAQLNGDSNFTDLYTVGGTGADVVITAKRPGVGFAVAEDVEATSAWSWATGTPNIVGTQIKLNINGYEFIFPCDSTSEENERDSLLTALQADSNFAAAVDMAADDSADPVFAITFTAKTAGVPFTLTFENENDDGVAGTGTVALTTTTANVTGSPVPFGRAMVRGSADNEAVLPSATGQTIVGVSINRAKGRPKDTSVSPPVTGEAQYGGDEAVPVGRRVRVWVKPETAVTPSSSVYFRHTQGANAAHTVGRFRATDVASEVDQITQGARWLTSADADALAVLEIDVMSVVSS